MTTYKTTEEAVRDLEMALYEIKTKGITRLKDEIIVVDQLDLLGL